VAARQLDVLVICGSLRKGSYNAAIARMLPGLAPAGTALRSAPSFADFPIYNADIQTTSGFPPEVNAWADAIRGADALIIVSPEYNWSIPGGLKNAIDWVSRMKDQPFKDKPVALQSAAGGILGGSRAQYHLRQSLTSVDAILFGRPEVIVTFAPQKFDEKTLELKDATAIGLIKQQLAAFESFVRRLAAKD
jgi:chromate reductase, NAD(P)H dehydrogenase (quinone)